MLYVCEMKAGTKFDNDGNYVLSIEVAFEHGKSYGIDIKRDETEDGFSQKSVAGALKQLAYMIEWEGRDQIAEMKDELKALLEIAAPQPSDTK